MDSFKRGELRRLYSLVRAGLILGFFLSTQRVPGEELESSSLYRVKAGDTLGEVLNSRGITPLWGKGRSVDRAAQLNAELFQHRPDLKIQAGDMLQLPEPAQIQPKTASFSEAPAPIPEDAPRSTASQDAESPLKKSGNSVSAAPRLFFSKLTGRGDDTTKIVFPSRLSYGVQLGWNYDFSEAFQVSALFDLDRVEYTTIASKSIDQGSKLYTGLAAESRLKLGNQGSVGLLLGTRERPFYRVASANAFTVNAVSVPRAELSASVSLVQSEEFIAELEGRGIFLFAVSTEEYAINSGKGYRFALNLGKKPNARFHLLTQFFGSSEYQNTSSIRMHKMDLGLGILLQWGLGR